MAKSRKDKRVLRHYKIRKKVSGTPEVPRFSIYKSNKGIYVQIIDDVSGKTIISSSTVQLKLKSNNIKNSQKVGKDIAQKAKKAKISKVVFDRGGFLYHGKIKALAETVRENGIKI